MANFSNGNYPVLEPQGAVVQQLWWLPDFKDADSGHMILSAHKNFDDHREYSEEMITNPESKDLPIVKEMWPAPYIYGAPIVAIAVGEAFSAINRPDSNGILLDSEPRSAKDIAHSLIQITTLN